MTPYMPESPKSMRLPGPEDRTLVVGRTGSGKSYFGLWLLSMVYQPGDRWIIIDYKREKQIAQIPYARYVDVGTVPREPGIYIAQPFPKQDISDYLMQIWDEENVGVFIDEGVMLANNEALDTILIQGRSKQIPVIMLSQRPVGISRFAFSESQFFAVFPSHDKRERKTISEFTPLFGNGEDLDEILLPPYHSYWYDVVERQIHRLSPVPKLPVILATFEKKLKPPELLEEPKPPLVGRRIMSI
jgi:hypothetical protein